MAFIEDKKTFYRNLLRLALPIALQSLMLALVAAGDALMLGRVAQDEMTAVSLATQIQFVSWERSTGAGETVVHWRPFSTLCSVSAASFLSCSAGHVKSCRNF